MGLISSLQISPGFAYRFFNCVPKACGNLTEKDFYSWFNQCSGRAKHLFRRAALLPFFRTGLKAQSGKSDQSMQEQWSRLSAPAKRLFFHRCQNNLCSVWHNYYGIYRAILAHGFDRTQFDVWWNGVTSREQALILDSLCKLVETANAQVKITGLTDEDHIIVRPALGAESGQLQIF